MSRQVLLDGYNVLQQMPGLNSLKLEDGRRGLVRFVEANRPQGSYRNSLTIVFDGKEDILGGEASGEVRVLFSKGETADDLIKRMVESAALPADMVLVTDDRDLGYYCKAQGAQLWSVAQFLALARKTGMVLKTGVRFKGPRPDAAESKQISDRTANQINTELSRLWLK
ncbi:MAG: NYN domain-containing protein [Candidatus Omnitrophica bacterium]|nr:NYN domain-containing protein [Candidatus Omnitrophota bacterium]